MRQVKLIKAIANEHSLVKTRNKLTNKYLVYVYLSTTDDTGLADCLEITYTNEVPTLKTIKDEFITYINKQIDEEIENCTWNNIHVQLNSENEFNYKVLYDFSKDLGFANLPVTIKLNNDNDSRTYYQFTTAEEFKDFYTSTVMHVYNTLNKGWKIKNMFDDQKYQEEIDNI